MTSDRLRPFLIMKKYPKTEKYFEKTLYKTEKVC